MLERGAVCPPTWVGLLTSMFSDLSPWQEEGLRPEGRLAPGILCLFTDQKQPVWGRARAKPSPSNCQVLSPQGWASLGGNHLFQSISPERVSSSKPHSTAFWPAVALPAPHPTPRPHTVGWEQRCQEELTLSALPACHFSPDHSCQQPDWAEGREAASKERVAILSQGVR